jgi:hypothetical protein
MKAFDMQPIPSGIFARQQEGAPGEAGFDGVQGGFGFACYGAGSGAAALDRLAARRRLLELV